MALHAGVSCGLYDWLSPVVFHLHESPYLYAGPRWPDGTERGKANRTISYPESNIWGWCAALYQLKWASPALQGNYPWDQGEPGSYWELYLGLWWRCQPWHSQCQTNWLNDVEKMWMKPMVNLRSFWTSLDITVPPLTQNAYLLPHSTTSVITSFNSSNQLHVTAVCGPSITCNMYCEKHLARTFSWST